MYENKTAEAWIIIATSVSNERNWNV